MPRGTWIRDARLFSLPRRDESERVAGDVVILDSLRNQRHMASDAIAAPASLGMVGGRCDLHGSARASAILSLVPLRSLNLSTINQKRLILAVIWTFQFRPEEVLCLASLVVAHAVRSAPIS
jgi:hypothetical protein